MNSERSSDRTCLVIGGRGFVGSALSQAATVAGWRVTAIGRDEYPRCVGRHFDVVINACGNSKRFRANREPLWDFDQSVRPVYASLIDFRCEHFVLISSVDVYNDPSRSDATSEDSAIDERGLQPYAFHKRLAEICVERRMQSWQIFRLGQMVGAHQSKGPIYDWTHGLPLWIDPRSEFPFIDTRHVGETAIALIDRAPRNQIYNICGKGSVELARLMELFPSLRPGAFAARERQVYRIATDKTDTYVRLPHSLDEATNFLQTAIEVQPC